MYQINIYFETATNAERAVAHYSTIIETSTNAPEILNSATVALGAYGAARTAFEDAAWPSWDDGWSYNLEMKREEERLDSLFRQVGRLIDLANEKTGRQINFFEKFWW